VPRERRADPAMSSVDLEQSLNFELQRSEFLRIWLVLGVLVLSAAVAVGRNLAGAEVMRGTMFAITMAIVVGAIAGGVVMLLLVRRAIREGHVLPTWFWGLTTVVETAMPTAVLIVTGVHSPLAPLDAVSAPAMQLYLIFAVASVLRLRPWLCAVGGVSVTLQHGALTLWAVSHTDTVTSGQLAFALSYTVASGVAWMIAALVSGAVRLHVLAGLREARTRTELRGLRGKLDMAREIQAGLLPGEPLRAGRFDVVGFNRPADETGGDYFDWITLPDGRVAVLIADVTGHGIGPAILMAVCRAYARATVPSTTPLTTTLARLNALITEDFATGRFVTLALALLDPRSGEVELISAGHGPTLLYRAATGAIESFGGSGPPLGVDPDARFDQPVRLKLGPGDALLLTTDGFVETARPDGKLYLTRRLEDSLRRHAALAPADVLTELDRDREAFAAGEPQRDDVTGVLLRCTGAAGP